MSNLSHIRQTYRQRYGESALCIAAPGRFNLIGEHTDYNLGWVMPGAIDKHLYFALGESMPANEVRVYADDMQQEAVFEIDMPEVGKAVSWQNYVKAVVSGMQAEGYAPRAFCCVFGGDIPVGAGLSSSAALCCGLIHGISEMQGLRIPRQKIALIAQAAEQRIGLNCGLMDQYAVLFGKQGHILKLDCKTLDFEYIPLGLQGYHMALFDSKVKHALAADSGYNERRRSCEKVTAYICTQHPGVQSLRDVSMEMLETARPALDPIDYRRAGFVLHENERVMRTSTALQHDDMRGLGQLLWEAHLGLREEYGVTCPETDLLADLAMTTPGVLGARQVGGGFGGCVLVLMTESERHEATGLISSAYQNRTGIAPPVYPIRTENAVEQV